MAVSKVVLGDETLIDLTGDSVSSENLLQGATAHAANGEQITGGVVVTPMYTGTKASIEEAIALGQIPEDAVVNITDDEETSSFQTQINEINSSLEWKLLGKSVGSNPVTFDASKYTELYLYVDFDGTGTVGGFANVPTILLSNTEKSILTSGGYQFANYGKYCNLSVSLSSATISYIRNDNIDTINSAILSVYGK